MKQVHRAIGRSAGILCVFALTSHAVAQEATVRMNVASSGRQGNGQSGLGGLSATGRHVVFSSTSNNLVAGDTNRASDVFAQDRDPDGNGIFDEGNGITTRASLTSCGFEGDGVSAICTISADGRQVAFASDADNLVAHDTGGKTDVFVHDRSLLPPDASWKNYGAGYPGTLGIPSLTSSANPVFGTTTDVAVGNSPGTATLGLLFAGTQPASIATKRGGTLLVAATLIAPLAIASAGDNLPVAIPNDPALCGVSAFIQTVEFDPGAQFGFSFTAGLELALGH